MAYPPNSSRHAAVTVLAVIGFLALVLAGILLAIYAARYVPPAISSLYPHANTADVTLTTVPTTTLPFTTGTSTATSTKVATSTGTGAHTSGNQVVGYKTVTSNTYTPGSTPVQVPTVYTGEANLIVSITAVGYIDDNGNFVEDTSINHSDEFAAKILVTNVGTNKTGNWDIHLTIPTRTDSTFEVTKSEPNLEPKGSLPLTLTLTRGDPRIGNDEKLSVEVDSGDDVDESDEGDNMATATFDVK